MPEGEEEEQEIEHLFEKIVKENFPNLAEEPDIQVQEAQRDSNKFNLKSTTPRHIIIKMSKVKDKEGILTAAREKQLLPAKEPPYVCQLISQKKHCRPEGTCKIYSK